MKILKQIRLWLLTSIAALLPLSVQTATRGEEPSSRSSRPSTHKPWAPGEAPRLLVLPWLVIDRNTNLDCAKLGANQGAITREAQRLAGSGQAAMDNMMHGHGDLKMIPRKEWEPHWNELSAGQVVRQGPGCSVCTPTDQLLQFDRTAILGLAQSVQADYVLIAVAVVPLTPESRDPPASRVPGPDDCCREALAQERQAVLARSSALLVRTRDGEVTWERDSRRLDSEVPRVSYKPKGARVVYSQQSRLDFAVRDTAHDLGKAFRRDCQEALR